MNSIKTHEWVSLRAKVASYYSCSTKVTLYQITFQIFMFYMYTHTHTHKTYTQSKSEKFLFIMNDNEHNGPQLLKVLRIVMVDS